MAAKQLKNVQQHRLSVAALSTDVTLTWDSVSGWPTVGDFMIRLDDPTLATTEIVRCTAVNVGALQTTVVRNQEGSGASAFPINSTGSNALTAQMITDSVVRLDTALSQSLTGPLVVPYALGGSSGPTSYGSMPVKIDEQLLGGAVASITFAPNPLPTVFRHLLLEWYAKGDNASTFVNLLMRFNNISTATYDYQFISAGAAVVSGGEALAQTSLRIGDIPAGNATANYFGQGDARVKHYQGAVGNKLVIANANYAFNDLTGNTFVQTWGGKWRTAATPITRLDLLLSAGNFVAGSLFTLWGLP